jgi:predicted PurR-regulated permease PerM
LIRLEVSYRGLVLIGLAALSIWALFELWPVILLVIASLIITLGLLPYLEAMVARGANRGLAVLVLIVTFVAVVVSLISLVVPAIIDEFQSIRDNLPASGREIDELLAEFSIETDLEARAAEVDWNDLISGRAAVSAGQRVLNATLSIITIIVLTAYLLLEMPNLARFLYQFIPPEKEDEYDDLFQQVSRVVGGYLRGQFITSMAIAVYTFVVLRIIGVPNPLAFAVLAGFPVAAALQESSTQAIIVLALLLAYQQFEDRFLIPRVYGRTLNLPPIIVLLAVLAGAELLGITGVLLALPLTAAGRVWVDYILKQRGVSLTPIEPHDDEPTDDEVLAPDAPATAADEPT